MVFALSCLRSACACRSLADAALAADHGAVYVDGRFAFFDGMPAFAADACVADDEHTSFLTLAKILESVFLRLCSHLQALCKSFDFRLVLRGSLGQAAQVIDAIDNRLSLVDFCDCC